MAILIFLMPFFYQAQIIELNYKVEYIGGQFEIDGRRDFEVPGCGGVRMFFWVTPGRHKVKITKQGQKTCFDSIDVTKEKKVYLIDCDKKTSD